MAKYSNSWKLLTRSQVIRRIQYGDMPMFHGYSARVVFSDGAKASIGVIAALAREGLIEYPDSTSVGARFKRPDARTNT